jgi:hypothetical protein
MKTLVTNLLVFLLTLVVALCVAEVGARLWLEAPQTVITQVKSSNAAKNTGDKKVSSISSHPDEGGLYRGTKAGRRLHPNRVVTIQNHRLSKKEVLIETNSLGYRNPEIGKKTGPRFLFLGDSITFADYLNEEETFVRRVESKARNAGRSWETINAGVGAISLKNELAILVESGLGLEPDVVVLCFYLNDFQWSKGVTVLTLPLWMENSWFLYHASQIINAWLGNKDALQENYKNTLDLDSWQDQFRQQHALGDGFFNESREAFYKMVHDSFRDYGGAWSPGAWEHMKPLFREFKRLADNNNFQLVVVGFPIYQQVYSPFNEDYPQQQLETIMNNLGVPFLDLLPPLREKAKRISGDNTYQSNVFHSDLFFDQCHHTEQGSEFVAEQIYQFLLTQPVPDVDL